MMEGISEEQIRFAIGACVRKGIDLMYLLP